MLVPISLLHVTVLPSLAIGWEANPLDFLLGVGSSSARAVDFSIFSVRTLHHKVAALLQPLFGKVSSRKVV